MKKKASVVVTTPKGDAEREEVRRIPETVTREQFERWLEGCASEIVAGGALASDPESKAWNNATFRARQIVKNYQTGHGLFQIGDLK